MDAITSFFKKWIFIFGLLINTSFFNSVFASDSIYICASGGIGGGASGEWDCPNTESNYHIQYNVNFQYDERFNYEFFYKNESEVTAAIENGKLTIILEDDQNDFTAIKDLAPDFEIKNLKPFEIQHINFTNQTMTILVSPHRFDFLYNSSPNNNFFIEALYKHIKK